MIARFAKSQNWKRNPRPYGQIRDEKQKKQGKKKIKKKADGNES